MKEITIGIYTLGEESEQEQRELKNLFNILHSECPETNFNLRFLERNLDSRADYHFYLLDESQDNDFVWEELVDVWNQIRESQGESCLSIYFRKVPGREHLNERVLKFINHLQEDLNLYINRYDHIDAVKWDMIISLILNNDFDEKLKLLEGEARLNGKSLLSLDNVPAFGRNETLQQARAEWVRQKEAYLQSKEEFSQNMDDEALLKKISKASKRQKKRSQEIAAIYQMIYERYLYVATLQKDLTIKDKLIMHAIICAQEGRIKESNEYLQAREREWELENAERQAEDNIKSIRKYISSQRLLILNLKEDKFQKKKQHNLYKIREIYKKMDDLVTRWQIEFIVLYEYARFLYEQGNYPEGIKVLKRLADYYKLHQPEIPINQGEIMLLYGELYQEARKYKKAEKKYKEALFFFQNTNVCTPSKKQNILITIYNNLGFLCWRQYRHKEGLDLLKNVEKQLLQMKKPSGNDPSYMEALGTNYNYQALIFRRMGQYDEAYSCYKKAIKYREILAKMDNDKYGMDLAKVYNNLGCLCRYQYDLQMAKEYFEKSLDIRNTLAISNPETFGWLPAVAKGNYGKLLCQEGENLKAEELFSEALMLKERYSPIFKEKCLPSLAYTCVDYANSLTSQRQWEEAKKLFKKAIKIRKKLMEKNRDSYQFLLAITYSNYAYLLYRCGELDKAQEYLFKSISMQDELADNKKSLKEKNYLLTCVCLAYVMYDTGQKEDACTILDECICDLDQAAADNNLPELLYGAPMALAKETLAHFLAKDNKLLQAEKLCQEAIELERKVIEACGQPNIYEVDLAFFYKQMAEIQEMEGKFDQAKEFRAHAEEVLAQYPEDYVPDLTWQ